MSLAAQRVTARNSLSPEPMATHVSPNLLVQQMTTQELLQATHTSSALVIRIRQTVTFQWLSTTLPTKQPIHTRCSSNVSHRSVQSCLIEHSRCTHASHHLTSCQIAHADRPKIDRAAFPRVTWDFSSSQVVLTVSGCPHSCFLWNNARLCTLASTKVEFTHMFLDCVLGHAVQVQRSVLQVITHT